MHIKMLLRSRVRPLVLNFVLFLLGVMTCLMFVQITNNEIDGPIVYSPQELQLPESSLLQTQQEAPCDEKKVSNPATATKSKLSAIKINGGENSVINPSEEVEMDSVDSGPTVWVVTPTFYRPELKPELTRLAQALLPVRDFVHWIIVDDVSHGSDLSFKELEVFVSRFSLRYTVLKSLLPKSTTKIVGRPRGVGGRTAAIEWLKEHYKGKKSNEVKGVVYFADDDNSYDSDIFRQMQTTKKVSMWPVGLVTDYGVSSPIVKNGQIVGFYDGWNGRRKFPVDMAGFAINIQLFLDHPTASMPWVAGYEEDQLLKGLGVTLKDIHPLANNCTEVLVWHTKAVRNPWPKRPASLKSNLAASTNLYFLLNSLPQKALAGPIVNPTNSDKGFSILNLIFGNL